VIDSMLKFSGFFRCVIPAAIVLVIAGALAAADASPEDALFAGWLKMYDMKFDDAHRNFAAWKQDHPEDSLGAASNAAAYLFSELDRLGALEFEFFTDDSRFKEQEKLRPDPAKKVLFLQEVEQADHLADTALQKSATDSNALFVKSLTLGLRSDYAGLVEKQALASYRYSKEGRIYAERLMQANPQAFDAYLGPGVQNYVLSLKAAPLRLLLRLTGATIDREKGLEEIRETAAHGHYLEPLAKLLLAVAALRDNNPTGAKELLGELHRRFPDNELYTRELDRIDHGLAKP
jgi:hypothetical protein